jgi:hypothetical protein
MNFYMQHDYKSLIQILDISIGAVLAMGRQTLNLSFILRADEKEFKGFGYFIN